MVSLTFVAMHWLNVTESRVWSIDVSLSGNQEWDRHTGAWPRTFTAVAGTRQDYAARAFKRSQDKGHWTRPRFHCQRSVYIEIVSSKDTNRWHIPPPVNTSHGSFVAYFSLLYLTVHLSLSCSSPFEYSEVVYFCVFNALLHRHFKCHLMHHVQYDDHTTVKLDTVWNIMWSFHRHICCCLIKPIFFGRHHSSEEKRLSSHWSFGNHSHSVKLTNTFFIDSWILPI